MGLRPDLKASKVGTDQQEGGKKFQNTGARKQKGWVYYVFTAESQYNTWNFEKWYSANPSTIPPF